MAAAAAAPDGSKTVGGYQQSPQPSQYQQPEIPDSRILQRPAETLDQFLQQQARCHFYNAQKEVRASNRDQIVRQYKIAKPDATDEEVRDAVDSGRTDVFASAIVSGRIQNRQQVLGQVQERQKALEKLAQSMEELVGLVQELGTLIEEQQGTVDKTDAQMEDTVNNFRRANENLGEAATSAGNARKNQSGVFGMGVAMDDGW
ncbi:t-SNARE [Zopfochytrium polystomum]|nr:t-SNARE [Zopfochytrium polystomum]